MIALLKNNIRFIALIVVVLALVVANVWFFMQWQSADGELAEVKNSETRAKTNLGIARANLEETRASNQEEIDKLQAEKAALSGVQAWPQQFSFVSLDDYLAKGLSIFPIEIKKVIPSSSASTVVISGKNYPGYETRVTVKGKLPDIIAFLGYVEDGPFNSLKTHNIKFTYDEASWLGEFSIIVVSQG